MRKDAEHFIAGRSGHRPRALGYAFPLTRPHTHAGRAMTTCTRPLFGYRFLCELN